VIGRDVTGPPPPHAYAMAYVLAASSIVTASDHVAFGIRAGECDALLAAEAAAQSMRGDHEEGNLLWSGERIARCADTGNMVFRLLRVPAPEGLCLLGFYQSPDDPLCSRYR
jgi:hypothetical protein